MRPQSVAACLDDPAMAHFARELDETAVSTAVADQGDGPFDIRVIECAVAGRHGRPGAAPDAMTAWIANPASPNPPGPCAAFPEVPITVHGLMPAHYAERRLIHEAARKVDEDPDPLSFIHAVRVVRHRVETPAIPPSAHDERLRHRVLDEILEERVVSSRGQKKPRGVKRKMSGYALRRHGAVPRRK